MEYWKPVEANLDYEISSMGRFRCKGFVVKHPQGGSCRFDKGIRKPLVSANGYLTCNMRSRRYAIHRLVAKMFVPNPEGLPYVDHINRDRKDNRAENLRWCTQSQNNANKKNARGVFFNKKRGKWQSYLMVSGKQKHLGYFSTEKEARDAYVTHARVVWGDFFHHPDYSTQP